MVFCAEKRGWVERRNAFFILEIFRATHRAGLGGGCIPRRCTPACSSAHGTAAQHRQQGRPCKARHTRPDAGRAASVCTRYQTSRAGTIGTARNAGGRETCPKLCRFGRIATAKKYISFLNTFVAYATENPFTLSQKCDIIMSQE